MNKALSLGIVSAVAPLLSQGTANAIALNFSTIPVVEVGEQVSIEILISDLGDGIAPSLGAYDFDVNFDSSILEFDSAMFGDAVLGNQLDIFGFSTINEVLEPSVGTVNLSELSLDFPSDLDDLQAESFTLATLTFDAVGAGTSNLELDNVILGDAFGDPLVVTTNTGSATVEASSVATVPESSTTISLLALGLLGWGITLRRQRAGKTYF